MANLSNINNKFIVTDGAHVSIGATTTTYPLTVESGGVGTVLRAGTAFVSIDSVGTAASPSLIFNGDDNTGIFRAAADTLAFSTAGSEKMRISSTGDILCNSDGGTDAFRIFNSSTGAGDIYLRVEKAYTSAAVGRAAGIILGSNAGNLGSTWTMEATSSLGYFGSADLAFTHNAGGTASRRVTIDYTGNVGIGTDSPSFPLTISGGAANTNPGTSEAPYIGEELAFKIENASWTSINGLIRMVQPDSAYVNNASMTFSTEQGTLTEKMRITNGGDVGIGTTSPSAKLSINVGAQFINFSGRDTIVQAANDPTNANIYTTQAGVGDFGQLSGSLVLQARTQGTIYRDIIFAGGLGTVASPATQLMTILGEGRVGIGTDSPNAKLDVKNNDGVTSGLHIVADINQNAGAGAQMILGYYANGSAAVGPLIYAANGMPQLINASGGINFSNDLSFSSNYMYTFRDGVGINNPNSQSAGGNAGYTMYVGRSSSGTVLGSISAKGTIRGSAFTSGADTPAGIGASLGDVNAGELGPGYINLSRDDTAAAEQIRFEKNGVLHSYIKTNSDAFIIGNNALAINPPAGKYGFIQHGVSNICSSGYVAGNATLLFTYDITSQGSMFIECVMNHYGYIATYGCARIATVAVGPVIQINNIQEITSANGGSWTFNRVSNTQFTVAKTAGTYVGGGYYYINIKGNGLKYT